MSFTHIDCQKIGVIFIVVVELNDVANLATERRSSKAAENEHERFASRALANMKGF